MIIKLYAIECRSLDAILRFFFHYKLQDARNQLLRLFFSIKNLRAKTSFFVTLGRKLRRAKKYPSFKSAACGFHPFLLLTSRSSGLLSFHIFVPSPTVSATQQFARRGVGISIMAADSLGSDSQSSFIPSLVR